ncbi:hypothetical protein PT300_00355 [Enterobacteriaceae bacterium ESL0689]|nr:hypothetical protein [Enterobacteriaceae bacterium ESL0689]
MGLTRSPLYLSCLLASLMVQANDNVPLLPDSTPEPLDNATHHPLGAFSLELKSQAMADWQPHDSAITSGRLAARLYGQGDLSGPFGIELNTRLRTQGNSREDYQVQNNIRLDVQSLAFSYTPSSSWRWVAGRTNIRNGVASGFNPTDWFKNNSQVIFESLDTANRREDRLGVVALEGVWLSEESVLSFGYRPDLHVHSDTAASNSNIVGLGLDRTNNRDAAFVKYAPSPASWNNLSLTLSSLYERDQPSLGNEVSVAMLDNVVLYNEWFAQRRKNLTDEARRSQAGDRRIYHQLASGVTWSVPESFVGNEDIAISVEYHINEAGIKQSQLAAWRNAVAGGNRQARRIAQLASIRQEPLARQQYFGRLAWNDFWGDNDLSFITTVTPMDGSGFGQLTLSAPIQPNMRLDLQGYHYFGSSNTIYGTAGRKDGWMLSFIMTL